MHFGVACSKDSLENQCSEDCLSMHVDTAKRTVENILLERCNRLKFLPGKLPWQGRACSCIRKN